MLKKSKICSELKKKLEKRKDVLDAFVFGSAVKGKLSPRDIDICIVFKENTDSVFLTELGKDKRLHISALNAENFFRKRHALIKTLMYEGISILSGKALAEYYSLKGKALYSYELRSLSDSQKVKFVHLLKGRGTKKGIISDFGGEFISNASFIVPVEKDVEITEIFNFHKVLFKRKQILIIG